MLENPLVKFVSIKALLMGCLKKGFAIFARPFGESQFSFKDSRKVASFILHLLPSGIPVFLTKG